MWQVVIGEVQNSILNGKIKNLSLGAKLKYDNKFYFTHYILCYVLKYKNFEHSSRTVF